ncbi:hypothetical protein D3C87_22570 [compost metagenome]
MNLFKEKYLELVLQYALHQKQGFETEPVIQSELTKCVRKANAVRDKLDKLCEQAKNEGCLNEINDFMFHEDKYVRSLTGMYCLFTNPEVAEKVLQDIVDLPVPNHAAPLAFTTLEVWKKGLLKL